MKNFYNKPTYIKSLVTIILPNYNHSCFLKYSIGNILKQTRAADRIIIIDDASTDQSILKIIELTKNQPKVNLITNKKNIGCIATLNKGLAMVNTEFVMFSAADDQLKIHYLEKFVPLLISFPSASFCCSASNILDTKGKIIGIRPIFFPSDKNEYIPPCTVKDQLTKYDNFFLGQTALYRTEHLLAIGGFNSNLSSLADGMAMRHLALQNGFCFIPDCLSSWRLTQNNLSVISVINTKNLTNIINFSDTYINKQNKNLFPEMYSKKLEKRLLFGSVRLKILTAKVINKELIASIIDLLKINIYHLYILLIISKLPILNLKKYILIIYLAIIYKPYRWISMMNMFINYFKNNIKLYIISFYN